MDVEPLPTVEEIAAWMRVPFVALDTAEKIGSVADKIRNAVAGIYTRAPVGVWWHPSQEKAAVCSESDLNTIQDLLLVKSAVSRQVSISDIDQVDPGEWVKVAYSPWMQSVGKALNFFPSNLPWSKPGPIASSLTSGLVGAGLGYGAGALGEKLLPDNWDKGRLKRTLAMVGGAAGAAPGMIWGGVNGAMGKPFNDNSLLSQGAGEEPKIASLIDIALGSKFTVACDRYAEKMASEIKEAFGDSFGSPEQSPSGTLSVDVDAMGRTLWETGANPQLAGMTMGALAAAQQMPGGKQPGFVTPTQMANLAAHMGAGYWSGAIVGSALGLLTGMADETQDKLKQTGMYVGIVSEVIPKLFGR